MKKYGDLSDRDKSAISALVEEYKTKTLQVMALDNEIHRWSASYMVALIIGIGWALNSDKIYSWTSLFLRSDLSIDFRNSYLILSVSIVNAMYILWLTIKGYQAQQIHYYLYTVTGKEITDLSGIEFNTFEVWRRGEPFCRRNKLGSTDWRRKFFYAIVTILPFGLSTAIIGLFSELVWPAGSPRVSDEQARNFGFLKAYFVFVVALQLAVAAVSLSTMLFDGLWKTAAKESRDRTDNGLEDLKA